LQLVHMVWNHYAQRNEPSSKIKDMKPHITDNLHHAVRSLEGMNDGDRNSIIQLQQASGNAYHNQIKSELDRRSMMVVEQDFKKWLAGQLEGANFGKNTGKSHPGKYERPCKVMNIRDPSLGKHFMDPYNLVERNHTNWGTKDLMSLPGVADYLKENDRQEMDGKMHDALLHDPSTGRLKDLESAWEYFCKFVVQQPDMFSRDINFVDAGFPGKGDGPFHPGNWGQNDHMVPLIPPDTTVQLPQGIRESRGTLIPEAAPRVKPSEFSKQVGPFAKSNKLDLKASKLDFQRKSGSIGDERDTLDADMQRNMDAQSPEKRGDALPPMTPGGTLLFTSPSAQAIFARAAARRQQVEDEIEEEQATIDRLQAERVAGNFDAKEKSVDVVGQANARQAGLREGQDDGSTWNESKYGKSKALPVREGPSPARPTTTRSRSMEANELSDSIAEIVVDPR
jgi:hypothetical protein